MLKYLAEKAKTYNSALKNYVYFHFLLGVCGYTLAAPHLSYYSPKVIHLSCILIFKNVFF